MYVFEKFFPKKIKYTWALKKQNSASCFGGGKCLLQTYPVHTPLLTILTRPCPSTAKCSPPHQISISTLVLLLCSTSCLYVEHYHPPPLFFFQSSCLSSFQSFSIPWLLVSNSLCTPIVIHSCQAISISVLLLSLLYYLSQFVFCLGMIFYLYKSLKHISFHTPCTIRNLWQVLLRKATCDIYIAFLEVDIDHFPVFSEIVALLVFRIQTKYHTFIFLLLWLSSIILFYPIGLGLKACLQSPVGLLLEFCLLDIISYGISIRRFPFSQVLFFFSV